MFNAPHVFDPQLPERYTDNENCHLLWTSEDGLLIDKVGCYVALHGREVRKWWPCGDNEQKAKALIKSEVVPYLDKVFGLSEPVPEVPEVKPDVKAQVVPRR